MKKICLLLILLVAISGCYSNNVERDLCIEETSPMYYSLSGKVEAGVRTINIEACKLACNPDIIVINHGEKIRLILTTLDNIEHGFIVRDLEIDLKIQPGKKTILEFHAEKSGIYELSCYVPYESNNKKMTGWFVVK
jgi:heme/copper-type cytochrome/quinol oxidase subunit 2